MRPIDASHRSQIENTFRDGLSVIEQFFGRSWLDEQALRPDTDHGEPHPCGPIWRTAVPLAAEDGAFAETYGRLCRLAELMELSGSLRTAQRLKNFESEVTQSILLGSDAASYLYAIRVAAVAVAHKFEVEFIQRTSQKTADLVFRRNSDEYHVECKKKARYLEPAIATPAVEQLITDVFHRVETPNHDCDILISVVGALEESRVESLVTEVAHKVNVGAVGFEAVSRDCIVAILRRPTNLRRGGAFAPGAYLGNSLRVSTTVGVDALGRSVSGPQLLCAVFVLQANSYAQLRRSFRRANSQLPTSANGLFFIDVDVAELRCIEIEPYLELLTHWILREFTPDRHRRVAAVMLTTNRQMSLQIDPNHGGVQIRRRDRLIVNPHNSAGERFRAAIAANLAAS